MRYDFGNLNDSAMSRRCALHGVRAAERPRAPKSQRTASVPEPTCHEFESRSSSQTSLGIPMPRFSKKAISSRRNGAKSKAVLALTEEQHSFFESAPALTLSAPERFWVERGSSARKMHLLAHTSWQFVVAHFDSVGRCRSTGCSSGAGSPRPQNSSRALRQSPCK